MSDKWDRRFLELAYTVASWSKDSTKVGAYIVNDKKVPMSQGYNGMPRGIDDDKPERQGRPTKYYYMEHAERNAIYNASGRDLSGTTMYVTHFPCPDCARAIIQNGIRRIVVDQKNDETGPTASRFPEAYAASVDMLNEAGIVITYINHDNTEGI